LLVRSPSIEEYCELLTLFRPVSTYGGEGVPKNGVHADNHRTIVYSERSARDGRPYQDNYKIQGKGGLRSVYTPSKSDTLDPLSRVNYTKVYTVEHNVNVKFIGQGDRHDHSALKFETILEDYPRRNFDNELGGRSQHATDNLGGDWGGLLYFSVKNHHNLHRTSLLKHSPETLGVINLVSAVGMGGTFVWIIHNSGPRIHSYAFRWVRFDVPT